MPLLTTKYGAMPSLAQSESPRRPIPEFERVPTTAEDANIELSSSDCFVDEAQITPTTSDALQADFPASDLPPNRLWDAVREKRNSLVEESSSTSKWVALAFGQGIAILATSMNASSYALTTHYSVNTQFFQLFWTYVLLSFHLCWREAFVETENEDTAGNSPSSQQHRIPFTCIGLRIPWFFYLVFSILDVLPNFMALISFHYTSLTSTTLLGSLTAPATMLFSKLILARSFGGFHYFGVLLCVIGGTITIWADVDDAEANRHSYIGDILAISAAILYGFGDTVAEFNVKYVGRNEYVGMLGLFGAIISAISFVIFERQAIESLTQKPATETFEVCAMMIWYILSVFFYYVAEAKFLVSSDATLLNLSMQASNLWAILFAVIAYHDWPPTAFYFALLLVVAGVFVYELLGGATATTKKRSNVQVPHDEESSQGTERPTNSGIV